MASTQEQYQQEINICKEIFIRKNSDYGTSWRLFRPSSLTDQLFIKAQRIRNIELSGNNNVGDDIMSEFRGIVNYAVMALVQLNHYSNEKFGQALDIILAEYDKCVEQTYQLMVLKNSDYSEVWREMRISSFTDMILVKLARIKQIEDNEGNTSVSEGADANYQDILNYAIFALIRLNEK
jgi:hypothetical protein